MFHFAILVVVLAHKPWNAHFGCVAQFLFLETYVLCIVAECSYVFDWLMLLNETLHVTLIKVCV